MKAEQYIMQRSFYSGKKSDESVEFNKNLQDFALQVSYICALETSGKMSPEESFKRVRNLWKQLKADYKVMKHDDACDARTA